MTFVDNVVMLAIENCLLRPMEHIFTSQLVNDMSEERIRYLAVEQPENTEKRARLQGELGKLRRAKRELRALSMDSSSPPPPPIFCKPTSSRADVAPVNEVIILDSQLATQTGFSSYAQSPSPLQTHITDRGKNLTNFKLAWQR